MRLVATASTTAVFSAAKRSIARGTALVGEAGQRRRRMRKTCQTSGQRGRPPRGVPLTRLSPTSPWGRLEQGAQRSKTPGSASESSAWHPRRQEQAHPCFSRRCRRQPLPSPPRTFDALAGKILASIITGELAGGGVKEDREGRGGGGKPRPERMGDTRWSWVVLRGRKE